MKFLWTFVLLCGVVATDRDHHFSYEDIQSYHYHPCKRYCAEDGTPMVCEYDFLLEHYYVLSRACYQCPKLREDCFRPHCVSADGVERELITVNRQLPGPDIQVCHGDTVRVRIHNEMEMGEEVTIHWHGQLMPDTPFVDGVAMITQCPIPAHTSYTYTFEAGNAGTHYWHAHSGLLRGNGVSGPLIIRGPPSDTDQGSQYDHDYPEHLIFIHDWWGRSIAPSFSYAFHLNGPDLATSMLINGKGMYREFEDSNTGQNYTTPRAEFSVVQGYKFRFRVICNSILTCPITLSIDSHVLTVIASDGYPLEAIEVESLTMFSGERYDFILNANQEISNYLIRAQGSEDCSDYDAKQTAILRYEGAPLDITLNTPFPELHGVELNPANKEPSPTEVPVTELISMEENDPSVIGTVTKQFVIGIDFYYVDSPRFHNHVYYNLQQTDINTRKRRPIIQMNHITMMAPSSPLLTQFEDTPQDMFCNGSSYPAGKNCEKEYCECIHLLKVDLNEVVEVILVDEAFKWNYSHPIHLHGHHFRVIAQEKLGDSTYVSEVMEMDRAGNISRNLLNNPVRKDTVSVPSGGYTIIRIYFDNPGMWFFHCHSEYHIEIGMGLVFQVGETSEFPKPPPMFPRCGNWDGYAEEYGDW